MPKEFKQCLCPANGMDVLTEIMPAGAQTTHLKCRIYNNDGTCPANGGLCEMLHNIDSGLYKKLLEAEERHRVHLDSTEINSAAIKQYKQNLRTYDPRTFVLVIHTIQEYPDTVTINDPIEKLWCLRHGIEV